MTKEFELPPEEVDLHVEQDGDGRFVVRALHRPTATIKIGEPHANELTAVRAVLEELGELVRERLRGLGS